MSAGPAIAAPVAQSKLDGWQHASLGKLLPIKYGKSLPAKLRDISGSHPVFGSSGVVGTHSAALTSGPTLIVGRKGNVGAIHYSTVPCWPIDTAYYVEAPTGHNLRYYKYLLESLNLARLDRSTAIPGLSRDDYNAVVVSVAPPKQQDEIVAEIEKQFSRLDEAVANLKRVKANLKRYKASVLKDAVEGRLVPTEADLARREGRSFETAQVLIDRTPMPPRPNRFASRSGDIIIGHNALAVGVPQVELPAGWAWTKLVEIARMESGHTPSRGHPEWWDGDVPWIGIADARDHHERMILDTIQHTNRDGLANSAARLLPVGTVCVSRTASVGYVVVMGKSMATSQDFVNWVPTDAVTSDWLRVIFTVDREALYRFGKGSVHKTIYFPEWLSVAVALPPLAEQQRVVAEVDRRLSLIRGVESEVDTNLKRAQALRQAVLAKTFSAGVKSG